MEQCRSKDDIEIDARKRGLGGTVTRTAGLESLGDFCPLAYMVLAAEISRHAYWVTIAGAALPKMGPKLLHCPRFLWATPRRLLSRFHARTFLRLQHPLCRAAYSTSLRKRAEHLYLTFWACKARLVKLHNTSCSESCVIKTDVLSTKDTIHLLLLRVLDVVPQT